MFYLDRLRPANRARERHKFVSQLTVAAQHSGAPFAPKQPFPSHPLLMKKNVVLMIFAAVWVCAVAAGLAMMVRYENAPGQAERTPPDWPASSRIPQPEGHPSLVLFAHPHCPCTHATMGEL